MGGLSRIFVIGLVYAFLGWLGLELAIPPGYASPVFPAAGLAVAVVLCYGNRVLPGIWLGSLAINLATSALNNGLGISSVMVAVAVACGATLQAWFAHSLIRRWSDELWRQLVNERDIAMFLLLVAPLACLVSATVGVSSLYLADVVLKAEIAFSWWNWWLGDMLGVLLFTPLLLTLLLRSVSPWKERQLTVAVPILVSLCVVTMVFVWVLRWEASQQQEKIAEQGQKIARMLDHRLIALHEALSSLRRLIEVYPDMSFRQFEHFTRITLHENRDIFALSYNSYISRQQRTDFEKAMAIKTDTPGFRITERNHENRLMSAADRPYYVAVGYIAPLKGNQPALGYDIYSEPVRRRAIDQAINFMRPAVTEPIQLVQEQQKRVGLLAMHPAYLEYEKTGGEKVSRLFGFAVAVIKVDEMVQIATSGHLPTGLNFCLRDLEAPPDRKLLYRSDSGTSRPEQNYIWKTNLTMADRIWSLEVFPTAGYLSSHRTWLAWGVGILGLLFVSLFQTMLLAMSGRNFSIQQNVNHQTIELLQAKEQLEHLNQSLQQRVDEAITELRQKDLVLIRQGRQAAMGEMIGNIAHQWRQPLNALSMLISNMQFALMENQLTEEYMQESAANADRLIQKMSTTINDFRDFFKPDREKITFSAMQQIRSTVDLVDASFHNSGITITVEPCTDCLLSGFPNEYSQVLLNLLSNAKDAVIESGTRPGLIRISLEEQDGMGVVTVKDNGNGVPEEISSRIFEPYFSTKQMGTGIGLYMSRMIIERNMNGTLVLGNNINNTGSEFIIKTPLAEG